MTVVSLLSQRSPRPLLLDLFCGAGGAARGYYDAGFDIVGVDIKRQPRYPYPFIKDDALAFLEWMAAGNSDKSFDAIHASPPCQLFTPLSALPNAGNDAVNLIEPTRRMLQATGLPYVIENVPQAPLCNPVKLCGQTFGLKIYRHRIFESNVNIPEPAHSKHIERCMRAGYLPTPEAPYMSIHGRGGHNSKAWVAKASEYMGTPWMAGDLNSVCEAIPPAYTKYIGKYLLEALEKPKVLAEPVAA